MQLVVTRLVPTMSRSMHNHNRVKAGMAIVGIGNPLAGDDGAGIAVVNSLMARNENRSDIFFYCLETDLFEMADLLDKADHFIFVDAFFGEPAGSICINSNSEIRQQPSLHQTDIGTVMLQLQALKLTDVFPAWDIYGIAVTGPFILGGGLSEDVFAGVLKMVDCLERLF